MQRHPSACTPRQVPAPRAIVQSMVPLHTTLAKIRDRDCALGATRGHDKLLCDCVTRHPNRSLKPMALWAGACWPERRSAFIMSLSHPWIGCALGSRSRAVSAFWNSALTRPTPRRR